MAKKNNPSGGDLRYRIMMEAVLLGVKPEDYSEFYELIKGFVGDDNPLDKLIDNPLKRNPDSQTGGRKQSQSHLSGMKDASEKTLKLRVQMQNVTKPPMWRELKVPADFTFAQLHQAIQGVCGFEDAHLWQFQHRAYDEGLQIGIPSDEWGWEELTHDARTTGITTFLAEKGQKLVYVYDFGDDWIFNISVVDVTPRDGEVAECIRWKCDVQPLEDSGGVYGYLKMRQAWEERNSLTKHQKQDLADALGYDSFELLVEDIRDTLFDPETVNEILSEI